jgi:hypothetical protein
VIRGSIQTALTTSFAVSPSRMRLFAGGVGNLGSSMPISCDAGVLGRKTNGIWSGLLPGGDKVDASAKRMNGCVPAVQP